MQTPMLPSRSLVLLSNIWSTYDTDHKLSYAPGSSPAYAYHLKQWLYFSGLGARSLLWSSGLVQKVSPRACSIGIRSLPGRDEEGYFGARGPSEKAEGGARWQAVAGRRQDHLCSQRLDRPVGSAARSAEGA